MNFPPDSDLTGAVANLAIANTPLFLLRKLQTEPAVTEVANRFSADEIVSAIERYSQAQAQSDVDFVRPYVYLVALSRCGDPYVFDRLERIGKTKGWEWFDYIRRVLKETLRPVNNHFNEAHAIVQKRLSTKPADNVSTAVKWIAPEVQA